MKTALRDLPFYLAPLPLMVGSLFIGPSDMVRPADIIYWLSHVMGGGQAADTSRLELIHTIVVDVRLPRVILAFLVGAALTVSGSSLQALFRNPLVSPYILGLSAGAAFGAALALLVPYLPLQIMAFLFGLIAVGLSYFLAVGRRGVSVVSLILAGVIVTGIFTALLSIVQFITDPFRLQAIVHWTLGNLHNATWAKVYSSTGPIVAGSLMLALLRWRMNILAMGDEETRAVGLNPQVQKVLVLIPATLIASTSVAVAGIIGMVGLAVPHMVRMMIGPDNTRGIPVSFFFGGSFLVVVDCFSRSISSFELPIGIFTILIGSPFFIYLLKKRRIGYWDV